jgi:hypothetical protein
MTVKPSQTALYGEILTNEQAYHKDVGEHPLLSHEEEETLVAQARLGNTQARERLLLSLLSVVPIYARWLYALYHWELPHIEYLDMIQEGNLVLLRRFDVALTMDNPCKYLCGAVREGIREYCWPTKKRRVTPDLVESVESLDRVLNPNDEDGDQVTLADLLEAYMCSPTTGDIERFALLRRAVSLLPRQQRLVVQFYYGLEDEDAGEIEDFERLSAKQIKDIKAEALARLYSALSLLYPHYCAYQEQSSHESYYGVVLRDDQRARLDAAREYLEAAHERVSVRSLSKTAKIDHAYASVYLKQRGELQTERTQNTAYQQKRFASYRRLFQQSLSAASA